MDNGLMTSRTPTSIFDESRMLADRQGFPSMCTTFACFPIVTTIGALAVQLSRLSEYPNDGVELRSWWTVPPNTRALTSLIRARDALLVICDQVVSGLSGIANASSFCCTCAKLERQRREARCTTATSPSAFPRAKNRCLLSFLPHPLSVLCEPLSPSRPNRLNFVVSLA